MLRIWQIFRGRLRSDEDRAGERSGDGARRDRSSDRGASAAASRGASGGRGAWRLRNLRVGLAARLAILAAVFAMTVGVAQAGTLHGTVKNGTTSKPGADIEVILIQLQGGMQPVANTKTDAQGQFSFDNPTIGAAPMLVRAVFHGVNFHQPVPPGRSDVEIEVFDPTQDAKTISVPTHIVIF